MAKPYLNTNSSYICLYSLSKFTATVCEIDIRLCKSHTYLSHETFICQYESGYEGIHSELLINYCHHTKCQNNGQCRFTQLNFTCECTSKEFSGRYCEIISTSLTQKQIINCSFGYIAIIAIICIAGFIILMDVLTYGFNIDPVDTQRKQFQLKKSST